MVQVLVKKIRKVVNEGKYQKMVKTLIVGDGKYTSTRPVIMIRASDMANGEKFFSDEDVLFVSRNSIKITSRLETVNAYISREPVDWEGLVYEDVLYLEGYPTSAEKIDWGFLGLPEQLPEYRI